MTPSGSNYPDRLSQPSFIMHPRVTTLTALLFLLIGAGPISHANPMDTPSGPNTVIRIHPDNIVRQSLPDTFFGFNIRWTSFQEDLWDDVNSRVKPQILDDLKPFPGALYRYPGGLVANEFLWEQSALPMNQRKLVNLSKNAPDRVPLFGINEFFNFIHEMNGTPLYVLNLVGKGNPANIREFPPEKIIDSNRTLAKYIKSLTPDSSVRYYQLGNELDRNKYEWPHDKYIKRSLDSIKAIQEVDSKARFIAFLREFNWRYRNGRGGVSKYQDFIRDVLAGLPMVNDYSLHFYYDDEMQPGGKFLDISEVVRRVNDTIKIARDVRKGDPINVWITEHSRRIEVNRENARFANTLTSSLEAAVSSADFLIAMAQIPEVKATGLHALNGIERKVFKPGTLEPNPIYWALRILNSSSKGAVLLTDASGPDLSRYHGGYDVRATAIYEAGDKLTLWAVNRSNSHMPAEITFPPFKSTPVKMLHYYLTANSGTNTEPRRQDYRFDLEPKVQRSRFSEDGAINLVLPPSSVSAFVFTKDAS